MARVPSPAMAGDLGGGAARPRFTLKPSKQTCMILGALIGLDIMAGAGLYVWQTGKIAAVRKEVEQRRAEVESGEKVAQRLAEVEANYTETREKIRYLESSVSRSAYVPTLLKQVEDLGKSLNLKINAIRPSWEAEEEPPTDKEARKKWKPQPYRKLHIDMQVSGTYWNTATLLYRLTEFPKILSVERVQLSPAQGTVVGQSPRLSVSLSLTGFVFRQDAEDAAAADKPGAAGAGLKLPPRASIDESGQVSGGLPKPKRTP